MKTFPDGGYIEDMDLKGDDTGFLKGETAEGYRGDSQGYSGDHSGYMGDIGI